MNSFINNLIDAYTRRTLEALADTLVPETPDLADALGSEHEPGARGLELGNLMARAFDSIQATDVNWSDDSPDSTVPDKQSLSPVAALILDYGTIEYHLLGEGKTRPSPSLGGPFCWSDPDDRLDILDYLIHESLLKKFSDRFRDEIGHLGLLDFTLDGLTTMVLMNYYGEWDGYENPDDPLRPDPETFTGEVQSWEQTGFPGQKAGYSVFKGYEVEEYKENDWS